MLNFMAGISVVLVIMIIRNMIFRNIQTKTCNMSFKLLLENEKILNYVNRYCDLAWSLLYSDDLLTYFVNNIRPSKKEETKLSKQFAKLVLKFIGPNLIMIVDSYFGNRDNTYNYLIHIFGMKFKQEIIHKLSEREISSSLNSTHSALDDQIDFIHNKFIKHNKTGGNI